MYTDTPFRYEVLGFEILNECIMFVSLFNMLRNCRVKSICMRWYLCSSIICFFTNATNCRISISSGIKISSEPQWLFNRKHFLIGGMLPRNKTFVPICITTNIKYKCISLNEIRTARDVEHRGIMKEAIVLCLKVLSRNSLRVAGENHEKSV
jgi:hypothetical protein